MLLSYVGIFMAVTPAAVGTTFFALGADVTEANVPSSQPSNRQRYAYPCRCLLSGRLSHVSGPTSPRLRTAPHEASLPFRQSLFSIARGTSRSDAPRMRRRLGTFRTREFSYRRLSAAGLRIAGCRVHLFRRALCASSKATTSSFRPGATSIVTTFANFDMTLFPQ